MGGNFQEELFVLDPIIDGKKVSFRRHNNGLESSHRKMRIAIRERTGGSETNREMEQLEDLGRSLSQFVKDLPRLRKEYHEIRRGPAIPIADVKRICVLGDFIEVLESTKPLCELISTLQAILRAEMSVEAVC